MSTRQKLLLLAMALGLLVSGCASIPANFNERATSELKIDIKLFSKTTYLPAEYGFSGLKGLGWLSYHPQLIPGVLVCTDDRVLFILAGREKYDVVVEIKYSDVVDVLVLSHWGGSGRRLVVKCKSQFYTFEVIQKNMENTYNFYRFIATKAGIEIKIPEPIGCVGSGHGNSVLTEVWCFDIGWSWPENLGFIFQGPCITSSQEAIGGRASSWMKKTFSASWPILRIARRDFPSDFMPTHC